MNNGTNSWGVSYSRIAWLENTIKSHGNVDNIIRHDDIIIEVTLKSGSIITAICLDEYVLGESGVYRVFKEFPNVDFISVGGNWNSYTPEAKQLCLSHNIGLFNSQELTGAIWRDDFWSYHQRDDKGNPIYPYKSTASS